MPLYLCPRSLRSGLGPRPEAAGWNAGGGGEGRAAGEETVGG